MNLQIKQSASIAETTGWELTGFDDISEEYQMSNKHQVIAVIQARIGSIRFPGKIMKDLNGIPCLQRVIERVREAKLVDDVIVATTNHHSDIATVSFCNDLDVKAYRGKIDNVLERVIMAANSFSKPKKDIILVDITADCPLVDPSQIDFLISSLKKNDFDYVSNIHPRTWPDGFDIQVYRLQTLRDVQGVITNPKHLSHVGWNIMQYHDKLMGEKLKWGNYPAPENYYEPDWGLTLDTPEDLRLLNIIFENFKGAIFTAENVIDLLRASPILLKINENVKRKVPGEG